MPRPIKDTPVLYDEDAYRFEMAAHNVIPLSEDEQEEMWASTGIVLSVRQDGHQIRIKPDKLFSHLLFSQHTQ